ncbi:hypothetical protein [Lacinutrix sp. Bg11-31]|uniref:hypothetical protein n=1 Tax=Lacinutrix sp. Bg11-31 TaxID=2057808 RepID=UPI000C30F35E|nr:hypothetical protein [Lacinutrix sp. Bg11-31]AUC83335.1 hypothetical protein CW733_14810 [Lacinutrix sp. Bg11-31]
MIKIILNPLQGIEIVNGKVITLGDSKTELLNKLGKPSEVNDDSLFYDEFELRVDIDSSGNIEFIEFICGPFPEKTEIEIYGINPFKSQSLDLIELLTIENDGVVDSSEAPYCYTFLESSIGVYRDAFEEEIDELIEGMKEMGVYLENKEWVLDDKEKAKYFWTIGLGVKDYYK